MRGEWDVFDWVALIEIMVLSVSLGWCVRGIYDDAHRSQPTTNETRG